MKIKPDARRTAVRNGFAVDGTLLIWTLAVPANVTLKYGITDHVITFDAAATTKTVNSVLTFIDTPPATTFYDDAYGAKLCDNNYVVFTDVINVAGVINADFVFDTEAAFVAFYAEFLADQVVQYGIASEL